MNDRILDQTGRTSDPHRLPGTWDRDDDWRGLANSAERRRRQNRLNQRAYRKRKHLQRCSPLLVDEVSDAAYEGEPMSHDSDGTVVAIRREVGLSDASTSNDPLAWMIAFGSDIRHAAIDFKKRVLFDFSLKLQAPTDLPSLVRLNFFSALASNATVLSISMLDLECDEGISPFNLPGPRPPDATDGALFTPDSLSPTALQRAISHHPWVDLFPFPGMRDNILRRLDAALLNEDELCSDLLTPDETDGALGPLVVWGEPCNAASWEISPEFLRKWGCLVQGCPDVLEATNFWRRKRGQAKLNFIDKNTT